MIEIEHLTKRYGTHTAVSDLNVRVEDGQIYGFLGPNGAGKSTTMNIMAGCLSATQGRVRIDGYDIFEEPNRAKRLIGYLPEQPPLYMNETPEEYLRFVGEAKGLRGAGLRRQMDEVVGQTGIEEVARRRISALSKGYRQRVGIAQALLGNPKVIILDEPTVGLDPIQIIEIRTLIRELGRTHTVIFSSHILSEVQAICHQIIMIARGKLAAFDTPENLEKQLLASNELVLTAETDEEALAGLLAGMEFISAAEMERTGEGRITAHVRTELNDVYEVSRAVFFAFAQRGVPLLELTPKKASLEDIFLELAEDGGTAAEPATGAELETESEVDGHGGGIEA